MNDLYHDKWGRIHNKRTDGINYSSNNGWLFTAIAKKVDYPLNLDLGAGVFCAYNRVRHPIPVSNAVPPISRDEILGLVELGFLKKDDLAGWCYSPYKIPKFNLLTLLKQSIGLIDLKTFKLKHRNTFWQNQYDQIYRFAFSVPLSDRHYILKKSGKYNAFYHIIHILAHFKKPKDRSARLLRFLKTGKDRTSIANYFGPEHPLSLY